MTDNEIIKALEHCSADDSWCDDCPYENLCTDTDITKFALDLINRQKAEIDKCVNTLCKKEDTTQLIAKERQQYYDELQQANAEIERLNSPVLMIDNVDLSENEIKEKLRNLPVQIFLYNEEQIRNEAIKEFAERLKERGFADKYYEHEAIVYVADIDNLVKEMVGES